MPAGLEAPADLADGGGGGNGVDGRGHHLAHERRAEHVGLVVALHPQPPPGQLLRHEALAQEPAGDEVGDDRRQHEREDDLVVPSQLEEEHDRGEGGPGGGSEGGGHGDEGEGAGGDVGGREDPSDEGAEEAAERAADEQHGREGAPRGARCQRHPPGEELGDGEGQQRPHRDARQEHVADGVVPHAQGPGHDEPDEGEAEGADHRVPELAHGQPPEAAFDEEQPPGDDHGQDT